MAKVTFNVSENKCNYSQRNNQFKFKHGDAEVSANSMCNVTSMCMGLDYSGYHFPNGIYEQPEDNLADFLMTDERVDRYYKEKMPAMYADYKAGRDGCFTPNQVHAVLAYGTNLWMGTTAVTFSTEVKMITMKREILVNSRPLVMSGVFNKLNHVVCVVGLTFDIPDEIVKTNKMSVLKYIVENKLNPTEVIIDDPWGDPLSGYKPGRYGNDIALPYKYFINSLKPLGNSNIKWAHTFAEPAAVV